MKLHEKLIIATACYAVWGVMCLFVHFATIDTTGLLTGKFWFVVMCLATARAVRLIRCDAGPCNVMGEFRRMCGVEDNVQPVNGTLADWATCPRCLGIFWAMPCAAMMTASILVWLVYVASICCVSQLIGMIEDTFQTCRCGQVFSCPPWARACKDDGCPNA